MNSDKPSETTEISKEQAWPWGGEKAARSHARCPCRVPTPVRSGRLHDPRQGSPWLLALVGPGAPAIAPRDRPSRRAPGSLPRAQCAAQRPVPAAGPDPTRRTTPPGSPYLHADRPRAFCHRAVRHAPITATEGQARKARGKKEKKNPPKPVGLLVYTETTAPAAAHTPFAAAPSRPPAGAYQSQSGSPPTLPPPAAGPAPPRAQTNHGAARRHAHATHTAHAGPRPLSPRLPPLGSASLALLAAARASPGCTCPGRFVQ